MKKILILGVSALIGAGAGVGLVKIFAPAPQNVPETVVGFTDLENEMIRSRGLSEEQLKEALRRHAYRYDTVSGHYLAGRFAQRHHDWKSAEDFVEKVINKTGETDPVLLKRAMVLSMGAGEYEKAFDLAREVQNLSHRQLQEGQNGTPEDKSALAMLFLSIEAFKKQDYQTASRLIGDMPGGSLSNFIMPLLYSWTSAALGEFDVEGLGGNTLHIHHAIMIADFMNRPEYVEDLLTKVQAASDNINPEDMLRIADIYAYIGKLKTAVKLYEETQATLDDPEEIKGVAEKISKVENGQRIDLFTHITKPEQGIAEALFDMAQILTQEYSDESARVFGEMALYLEPDMTQAQFLMAQLAARNEQEDEAIRIYRTINAEKDPKAYIEARRLAADMLEDEGKTDEALAELESVYSINKDAESLIQMGDIYRRTEEFDKALNYYNKAASALGDPLPDEYWHLYYVRGMAYEQLDQWDKAEKDLQAALAIKPDHPFILNYLGYAWADQGKNLDQSLNMITRAANLRPDDGYITDSLGWVLYRLGEYKQAVPHLEKAVELMPYDPTINDHLGDAYWRVGRKLEARFQWQRAINHAEEDGQKSEIEAKLVEGLPPAGQSMAGTPTIVQKAEANSQIETP
ncbi:MAG: tetratricopeptide repeat protein [Alphaproteobacteria bacterium]|nr:tetratricopeptide repeat protein [Alphaproteobacteria bacterium]